MDDIQRFYRIEDVLNIEKGKKAKCPFHDDRHPSLSIYYHNGVQKWRCHRCDIGGDIIDLIGYMSISNYTFRHRNEASEILQRGNYKINPVEVKQNPLLPSFIWQEFLPIAQNCRDYCNDRGMSNEIIDKYNIGSFTNLINNEPEKNPIDRYISIPVFTLGTLTAIKFRIINMGKFRYWSFPGSKSSLFNHDNVYHYNGKVVLVKGEIAAMVLEQYLPPEIMVCAPTTGENKACNNMLKEALVFSQVYVIGDNDEVGIKSAQNRANELRGELLFPPYPYKDIDEFILKDESSREWLTEKIL